MSLQDDPAWPFNRIESLALILKAAQCYMQMALTSLQ